MAKVKNLVAWAGPDFSYIPGDVIDLPDDVALAREAVGLVEIVKEKPAKAPAPAAAASVEPIAPVAKG